MSVTVPISVKAGKLPLAHEFTPAGYRSLLLQRLELSLSGDRVLLGTKDATAPTRNVGAWFDPATSSMWAWNDVTAQYEPIEIGFKNGSYGTTMAGNPSANRTLTLPNATGTAALLTDVTIPKETVMLTSTAGTVSAIDANVSNNFYLTLTENSTIPSISNMALGSGKKIRIAIVNSGTSYTVTWPSAGANAIKWPTSPSHTQPVATVGQPEALAIYTITEANIGQTYHLFGDPEVAGFSPPDTMDSGGTSGGVPSAYQGVGDPLPKGRYPYNEP